MFVSSSSEGPNYFVIFLEADFNQNGQPCSGRISDILLNIVEKKPRISKEDIAKCLKIDTWTTFRKLKRFCLASKHYTCYTFSDRRKKKLDCVSAMISLQLCHDNEPFLDGIFKGDEKWLSYDNVRRKLGWIQYIKYAELVSKADLHPMIVLLPILWDSTLFCFQLHQPKKKYR